MSLIPQGSIVCSGFGDSPIRFFDPLVGGELTPDPSYIPNEIGTGGCESLRTFSGVLGGAAVGAYIGQGPNNGIYLDPNWQFRAIASQNIGNSNSGGYVVNDHLYGFKVAGGVWHLLIMDAANALITDLTTPFVVGTVIESIAVNDAETHAYIAITGVGICDVHDYDLIGNADLGVLFTRSTAGIRLLQNALLCQPSGDIIAAWSQPASGGRDGIERFNSAGVKQEGYNPPTYSGATGCHHDVNRGLIPAPNDPTVMVLQFYDTSGIGYGVSFARMVVLGGALLSGPFTTPLVGAPNFEWDGPAIPTRTPIGCPACPPPGPSNPSSQITIAVGPVVGGGAPFDILNEDDQMVQERFFAHETLSPGTVTALKLTNAAIIGNPAVGLVLVTVDGDDARYWLDGSNPTAAVGNFAARGQPFQIAGHNNILNFRVIATTGTATVAVSAAKP